jgi:hypothetical protein
VPWYVVNGCPVHLKLSGKAKKNPPKPCCARVERDGRAARCAGISTLLCDWPVDGGGTCDAPLCPEHATEVGRDRHYCPAHRARQLADAPELF